MEFWKARHRYFLLKYRMEYKNTVKKIKQKVRDEYPNMIKMLHSGKIDEVIRMLEGKIKHGDKRIEHYQKAIKGINKDLSELEG